MKNFKQPLKLSSKRRRRGKKYAIKVVTHQGKDFHCQGYEPYLLEKLVAKYGAKDVISQYDKHFVDIKGGRTKYRPDFYVRSRDTYVEVKSVWTLYGKRGFFKRCVRKAKAASVAKKKLATFVVFPLRKTHLRLPDNWWKMKYEEVRVLVTQYIERQ